MSGRSGGLALGAIALAAAYATGSSAFAVAGVGFLVAGALTWVWTWYAERPVSVSLAVRPAAPVEGDRVHVEIETRTASRIFGGARTATGSVGRRGPQSSRLRAHGRTATGELELGALPRGVYPISQVDVQLGDLLGLVSVSPRVVANPATVIVHPRLVAPDGLFSDAGRLGASGRRLLLRRTAGFELHSVRAYEQGESLRRVHWPTSARRGQLMVKELEDTAQDGVVVVLDCDPAGAVGDAPHSSFDVAVRAAGSLVHAYAQRGRAPSLVCARGARAPIRVRATSGGLDGILNELAGAEPDEPRGLVRLLGGSERALAGGGELVVVTSTVEGPAFSTLLAASQRRLVSVVWIDAASFAGRPTRAEPGLLRLVAHGIPATVVRLGDDLAEALSAPRLESTAHA